MGFGVLGLGVGRFRGFRGMGFRVSRGVFVLELYIIGIWTFEGVTPRSKAVNLNHARKPQHQDSESPGARVSKCRLSVDWDAWAEDVKF